MVSLALILAAAALLLTLAQTTWLWQREQQRAVRLLAESIEWKALVRIVNRHERALAKKEGRAPAPMHLVEDDD